MKDDKEFLHDKVFTKDGYCVGYIKGITRDFAKCTTECQIEPLDIHKDYSTYTYAEVHLPEWWDGRPIKGYAWDGNLSIKKLLWCLGYDPFKTGSLLYACTTGEMHTEIEWYKHFEPITNNKTVKVTIEENGKTREVVLTDEQVKELGL